MLEAPDSVIDALNKQDLPAFKAAVDALEKPMDHYMCCDRRLVVWVAREEFGGGVAYLLRKGAEPVSSALQESIFFGQSNDISAIEALLEAGADADKPVDGQSPMGWAASINSGGERAAAIVRALIAHGADPDAPKPRTPLHQAVTRPATDVARALLEAGADPNHIYDEQTPTVALMLAMRSAFKRDREYDDGSANIAREFVPKTLRVLLDHGADSTIRLGSDGASPLLFALSAKGGCPDEVVQMLCEAGPDITETIYVNDNEHIDLLTYALLTKAPHAQQLALVKAGFPLEQPYELTRQNTYVGKVAHRCGGLCELLWNEGGDTFRNALVDHRSAKSGLNALTLAAISGNETMVRAVHQAGVSTRDLGNDGRSVAEWVHERAPTMLPLIEELAASEGTLE